jgi:diguanylate cyclase (GGDEF)-like protein
MLTGVANRRHFVEQCERELYRADREASALSLLMLDLDHFKSINDRHGHAAGDAVLTAVAQRCHGEMRQIDIFGRLGGEEFGVMLPGVDATQAVQVAERLRQVLETLAVGIDDTALHCTASFGVATRRVGEGLDALLARADHHLYAAKAAGRNCVVGESVSGEDRVGEPAPVSVATVRGS